MTVASPPHGNDEPQEPTTSEREAIEDSGLLIRFIAEAAIELPPDLAKTIETSRVAALSHDWTPDAAETFWQAYSHLSELAKPATIDTVRSSLPLLQRKRWLGLFGATRPISLSRRTAENYIIILILTSIVILSVQLYAWGINQQSLQIGALTKSGTALAADVTSKSAQLSAVNLPSGKWPPVDLSLDDQISTDSNVLSHDAGVAAIDASTLRDWSLDRDARKAVASTPAPCLSPSGNGAGDQWWCKEDRATKAWADTEDNVLVAQQRAEIFSGILNGYILPVLFGLAGSLVFVIRTISEQIKSNTFASVSPLRHLLRVWLGPLMGLVVSLFSSVIQLQNIGPLALAFLAGYAVEGLFSLFDNLVRAMTGSSNSGDHTAGSPAPKTQ